MARRILHIAGFSLAVLLSACGGGGDPAPAPAGPGLQSLRIANKGSYVTQSSSTTDYAPGRIQYQADQFGNTTDQFAAALGADDFSRLAALVDAKDLIRSLGKPNNVHAPCRSNDLRITIRKDDVDYQFTIPGSQTCGSGVPPGLNELLELDGQLVTKYRPAKAG